MTSLATTDVQDDFTPVEDTPTPAATNTEPTNKWAENNDDSEEEEDEDVAPGRENKKRARPESSVQEGQNKSTKTSSDETEDGEDDEGAVVTITITIPSSLAGCVIGRGGTVIKSTREQSGANVNVSKEEISPGLREVTLTGQAHEVAAARTMVEAQVEAKKQQNAESGETDGPPANAITVIMVVPNAKVGGLIGKGGSSINEIRNASGCRINIQDSRHGNRDNRDVTIIGTLEQTQQAQTMIQAKLLEIIPREQSNRNNQRNPYQQGQGGPGGYGPPPGYANQMGYQQGRGGGMHQAWNGNGGAIGPSITTQVSVPDDSVGRLIGRGGETINRIRQMSACRIDIAKSDAQSQQNGLRIITLTGTEQTIKLAQDMLR
jgi:transcription antitermination factor NusA-like protein